MQIQHCAQVLTSRDGIRLYQQSWLPPDSRAAILLVHGYAEHSGRYAELAVYLAELGFTVHAFDLRGHGRSAGPRVLPHRFEDYVSDLATCWSICKPVGQPAFLLGHSMGSLVMLLFLLTAGSPLIRGFITSGTALAIDHQTPAFQVQLVTALSRWLPQLPVQRLDSSLISSHPQQVQAYERDPLIYHGGIPARTAVELFGSLRQIRPRLSQLTLPALILHGAADRLAPVAGSQMLYEQIGSCDKALRLYAGLGHELLNEPERAQVLQEIGDWLRAQTAPDSTLAQY